MVAGKMFEIDGKATEPTASLLEAIKEVNAGKTKECQNVGNLFKEFRKKANV